MESLNTPESGTIFFIDTTAANLDEEGGSTERRDLEESSMNVKIKMKDDKLTINKEYANKYHRRKEEEERSLLREKYGEGGRDDTSSSSSSEEEDEDAEGWTSDVERNFLRTLSLVKSRDPSIYDSKGAFFSQAQVPDKSDSSIEKTTSSKPMYLKDFERKQLLEKGRRNERESDLESNFEFEEDKNVELTYSEEQKELKESFKAAAEQEGGPEGEEEEGGLLVLRNKTEKEKAEEEREYVQWLKGEGGKLAKDMAKDLAPLREYWKDPSLSADEQFLRDYILNRGHLDKTMDRIPTYNEVVGSGSETPPSDSEDEEALEKQEIFERKYNFRFEEPDGELISSYPRTLGGSVRRQDDSRRVKRKERAERKLQEKEARQHDLRRLRNLQQKEMKEKLERLANITGNPVDSFGLGAEDIEGDFDPDVYDQAMQRAFNEDYYEGAEEDEEKPEFSDLEEVGDESFPWIPEEEDDPDFNMDADFDASGTQSSAQEGPSSRRRKRSRLNLYPNRVLLEKEELENRLKGELFRYREVEPNDFGLTTEEILFSENKELNRWVSLSKSVQYLTPEEEVKEKRHFLKKSRNWKRKKAILTTYHSAMEEEGSDSSPMTTSKIIKTSHVTKKIRAGKKVRDKIEKLKLKGKKISDTRLKSYCL